MIDRILKKYPKDVKIIIKHMAKDKITKYALASHKQGKYLEMYHKIMTNQDEVIDNPDLCLKYAQDLELDMDNFKGDSESNEIENQILNEVYQNYSSSFSVNSKGEARLAVPRFLIQGRELWTFQMNTRRTLEDFSKIIDQELKKLN